jgi:hypothetical protein
LVVLAALGVGIGTVKALDITSYSYLYATADCPPANQEELDRLGAVTVYGSVDYNYNAVARLRVKGAYVVSVLNRDCEPEGDTSSIVIDHGGGGTTKFKFSYAGKKLYLDFFNTQTKKHYITGAIKLKSRGKK